MVRIIPPTRPEDLEHNSERLVLEALLQLSDDYVVLHSFPWLRPRRDLANEPLVEGEADFVILHAARGMLILEVKGGVPEYRQRLWYRGAEEIKDPFRQATDNLYALLRFVEERSNGQLHRRLFTYGHAVVFPHCTYAGPLPLNTDQRILLDGRDLTSFAHAIEEAFDAWTQQPGALSQAQLATLLTHLMPPLRLVRCVGSDLISENARIIQATEAQLAVLRGFAENDRVLVQGSAGSGKTLLALELAVSMAMVGRRTLLLCFNHHLSMWLQEQASAEPRLKGRELLLEISTFHSFALGMAERAGVEFDARDATQEFWDEEVPLLLEQALDILRNGGRDQPFDAVIVDEAQDFFPNWWVTVESLTRGGRAGRLYALLDLDQCLRGAALLPPVPLPTQFSLRTNCRNTRAITRSSARVINVRVDSSPGVPAGEPPAMRRAASRAAGAGVVLGEVRRLLGAALSTRQLALIGPAALAQGALARAGDVDGIPLTTDAVEWRRGRGILVTTASSFKGLEADVVLLYDLAGFSEPFSRAHLYVAWTRARMRLFIFVYGDEARGVIEAALAEGLGA